MQDREAQYVIEPPSKGDIGEDADSIPDIDLLLAREETAPGQTAEAAVDPDHRSGPPLRAGEAEEPFCTPDIDDRLARKILR